MSRGWSLEDLAAKLGGMVSRQALHKYEGGEMMPSPSVLSEIARVLGVTPQELATGLIVSPKRGRSTMTADSPKRGEIWLVRFAPSVGDEIKKERPAVVLSSTR